MPLPTEITLSASALLSEIEEFRQFLNNNPRAERVQFLLFFAVMISFVHFSARCMTRSARVRT